MIAQLRDTIAKALGRKQAEHVLSSELQYHLEQLTAEHQRAGLSFEEARRKASLQLGSVDQIKEECRDHWGTARFEQIQRDFVHALRNLWRSPGYALLVILTLALGAGSNTALFSLLEGLLLRSLPFSQDDRLVLLEQYDMQRQRRDIGFSVQEMEELRAQASSLEGIVEFHNMRFTLLGSAEPEVVETGVVSGNYFDYLGVKPIHGRTFVAGEEHSGAPGVLVLSYRYFRKRYGGDGSVVGKTVRMNDRVHTIVGILPPLPDFPARVDVYMPTTSCPSRSSQQFRTTRNARLLTLVGRVKPSATIAAASQESQLISRRFRQAFPDSYPTHEQWGARLKPLREQLTEEARPTVLLLFGATGLLLLIACANVANLTLARMMQRERELAVRTALGASRWRLFQQVATEAVVVAGLAFACALGIAHGGLSLLVSFAARVSPRVHEISLNGEVMLFCGMVSLVAALLAYLLPVQSAISNLVVSTRQGGHGATAGKARSRARGLLVTAQVALSFVLLTGAGLLFRSFLMVSSTELGAKPERVVVMTVSPNWSNIRDGNQFRQFFRDVLRRVRDVPGVSIAGVGARVPLNQRLPFMRSFVIEGQTPAERNAGPVVDLASAGPGYFEALGIPLLKGRLIGEQDHSEAPLAAVVSDSFAKHHWATQDPVGRRVSLNGGRQWITIVGVVGDVRHYGLERDATEQLYTSFAQGAGGTNIVIRTAMEPASLLPQFRQAVYAVDPESAIASMETMEFIRAESLAPRRVTTMLLALFSGITLLITLAGISGVSALVVSQKLPEIGIRMALGARPAQLIGMLLGQQMQMVILGVVIGVTASLALTKWLSTFLYKTHAADPLTYSTMIAFVIGATALACLIPARRAAWADPLKSLRSDA